MSRGPRLIKHIGMMSGRQLGIRLLDAVVSVILARYLAPQGYGLLAFSLAFVSLFSILPAFGMNILTTRDLARDPQHLSRYLCSGLIAKAFLGLLVLVVIWIVTQVCGFPMTKRLVILLAAVAMVLNVTTGFTLSPFQAAQRMSGPVVISLFVHGGWVVGSLGVVALGGGLVELMGVRVFVMAAGLVAALALVHFRLQRITWAVDLKFIPRMLKASLPFALVRFFGVLYVDIGMVMLSLMRGDVMTGWFAIAQKFVRMFTFVPFGFFSGMLPELSRTSRSSYAEVSDTLRRGCKYLVLIALPIAGGICLTADRLIPLVFGQAYEVAIPALQILIWVLPFSFVNSTLRAGIASVDQERRAGALLVYGVLFSVAANLVAIPRFGHVGVAATTLLTEGLIFLLQMRLLRGILPDLHLWGQTVKPLGAVGAMMAVSWLSRSSPLVYTIVGSAVVYLGVLVATRTLGHQEWTVLRQLFGAKPLEEPVR